MNNSHEFVPISLMSQNETELLKRWFEVCTNYSALHYTAFCYYKKLNYAMMIPIMILTTFSGTFNMIISFHSSTIYFNLILGILGLLSGMLSSIYNFLEIPHLQEQHSMYSTHFEKFARTIEMELVLFKNDTKTYNSLGEFVKIIKTEIDILIDNGPYIPHHIVSCDNFNTQNISKCSLNQQIQNYEFEKSKKRSSFDSMEMDVRKKLKEMIIKDDDVFISL